MPAGLGLFVEQIGSGSLHFRDARGRLTLDMLSVGGQSVSEAHAAQLADAKRRSAIVTEDDFSKGDTWFALTSRSPDGSRCYVRLYQDDIGTIGFALSWRDGADQIAADRIAAIMAGSLRAAVIGEPFAEPPQFVSLPKSSSGPRDR